MSYPVIYADPPWSYNNQGRGAASGHYDTVSIDRLCQLPVHELAHPDGCALFMWATWPLLPDALRLINAWGFEYVTNAFTWVKRTPSGAGWHMGGGFWTRSNTEPCLFAVRRGPGLQRRSRGVFQLIVDNGVTGQQEMFPTMVTRVGEHSAKPVEAYHRIERLFDGPYLELFARTAHDGWDVWGNEAPSSINWQPEFMESKT